MEASCLGTPQENDRPRFLEDQGFDITINTIIRIQGGSQLDANVSEEHFLEQRMLSPCSQPKMPRTEINPGWPCFPKKPLTVLENEGRICQSRGIDICLTLRDEPDPPILNPPQ